MNKKKAAPNKRINPTQRQKLAHEFLNDLRERGELNPAHEVGSNFLADAISRTAKKE